MSTDNEIVVKLTALGDDFQGGLRDALGSWNNLLKGLQSGEMSFAGAATASVGVAGALFGVAKATADAGEHIGNLSDKTGIAVEDLSLLEYAASQSGTNIDALAKGALTLNKNLLEAASGNEKAATAFEALGLNVDALLQMPVNDRILAMADALADVEEPGQRSTIAIELLGKSAADLLPLMLQGADGIQALKDKGEALGAKMTGEMTEASKAFNGALGDLWVVIKSLTYDLGEVLLPIFQKLFEGLVILWNLLKDSVIMVVMGLVTAFEGLATGVALAWHGIAKITDLLGITKGESEATGKQLDYYTDRTKSAGKATVTAFNDVIDTLTGTAHAQTKLSDGVKNHTNLTDKQREAILKKSETDKEAEKTAKAAQAAEKERLADVQKSIKDYQAELDTVLEHKKKTEQFDEEYFAALSIKYQMDGQSAVDAAEMVEAEKKKLRAKGYTDLVNVNELERVAIQGVADAVKSIWNDSETSTSEAFRRAADSFVNVMAEMVTNAIVAGKAISLEMAAATSGVTLLVGLLASVMGGGGKKSKTQSAVEGFLRDLRAALAGFEDEILSTMEKLTRAGSSGSGAFTAIQDLIDQLNEISIGGQRGLTQAYLIKEGIVRNMDALQDAIVSKYNLEKSLINEVSGLIQRQKDFVKDIDQSIKDVARSGYTKEQLFSAQKGDIASLLAAVTGASGEEKISLAGDLKQAYLAYFETAKGLLVPDERQASALQGQMQAGLAQLRASGASSGQLAAYRWQMEDLIQRALNPIAAVQDEVLRGLENVKGYGATGFDQLVDVNLEMLGVQREGADLQAQMAGLLGQINDALLASLQTMEAIATAGAQDKDAIAALVTTLGSSLSVLGFDIPQMATGGIVTSPTLALIGERGPEAVIPLGQAGGMGGGITIGNVTLSLPNVKDFRSASESDCMEFVKKLSRAAERVGGLGYKWGMAS